MHQTKPYPNFSGKALFFVSRRFELRSRRRGFFYACGHLSPARADFRHRRSLAVGSRLRETANSLKVHQTKPYPNFSGKALFFVSRRFELRSRRRGFFYACGHLSPARADFRHRRSLAVGSRLRETANSLKVHHLKRKLNRVFDLRFFVKLKIYSITNCSIDFCFVTLSPNKLAHLSV